jgi:hypothetical protein
MGHETSNQQDTGLSPGEAKAYDDHTAHLIGAAREAGEAAVPTDVRVKMIADQAAIRAKEAVDPEVLAKGPSDVPRRPLSEAAQQEYDQHAANLMGMRPGPAPTPPTAGEIHPGAPMQG